MTRVVEIGLSATKQVKPDTLSVKVNLCGEAEVRDECLREYNARFDSIIKALLSAGVGREFIKNNELSMRTRRIPIYEKYEKDRYYVDRYVIDGHEYDADITAQIPVEANLFDTIWENLLATDADANVTIRFTLANPKIHREALLTEAVESCKQKARVLAAAAGETLGRIIKINYDYTGASEGVYMEYPSMEYACCEKVVAPPTPTFNPDDIELSCHVNTVWEIAE